MMTHGHPSARTKVAPRFGGARARTVTGWPDKNSRGRRGGGGEWAGGVAVRVTLGGRVTPVIVTRDRDGDGVRRTSG